MFEGHDTTSAAISWILLLIASDPDIQNKLIEEIDSVMGGDRERAPTMKELNDMKYMECCIKEGLRLYPSVPMIARQLFEDVNLGLFIGKCLKKRNFYFIFHPNRRLHRSRWLQGNDRHICPAPRSNHIPETRSFQPGPFSAGKLSRQTPVRLHPLQCRSPELYWPEIRHFGRKGHDLGHTEEIRPARCGPTRKCHTIRRASPATQRWPAAEYSEEGAAVKATFFMVKPNFLNSVNSITIIIHHLADNIRIYLNPTGRFSISTACETQC
jgi:hypothetical protein